MWERFRRTLIQSSGPSTPFSLVYNVTAVTLSEAVKDQSIHLAGCLYRNHGPADKRWPKSAPSCLLGRTWWSFFCLPWSYGRAGCPLLQPVSEVKGLRPARRQQLPKGHSVPPDTARLVRLFMKLLLAKLPIKYSCENVASLFSSPSLWPAGVPPTWYRGILFC